MAHDSSACNNIIKDFESGDAQALEVKAFPKKFVYVISIKERGRKIEVGRTPMEEIINMTGLRVSIEAVKGKSERLKRIGECSVIYIGASPSQKKNRFKSLCVSPHTAQWPFWSLLILGWKLTIFYSPHENPVGMETKMLCQYWQIHGGNLPALNERRPKCKDCLEAPRWSLGNFS